jgi:hypothetical protein
MTRGLGAAAGVSRSAASAEIRMPADTRLTKLRGLVGERLLTAVTARVTIPSLRCHETRNRNRRRRR